MLKISLQVLRRTHISEELIGILFLLIHRCIFNVIWRLFRTSYIIYLNQFRSQVVISLTHFGYYVQWKVSPNNKTERKEKNPRVLMGYFFVGHLYFFIRKYIVIIYFLLIDTTYLLGENKRQYYLFYKNIYIFILYFLFWFLPLSLNTAISSNVHCEWYQIKNSVNTLEPSACPVP